MSCTLLPFGKRCQNSGSPDAGEIVPPFCLLGEQGLAGELQQDLGEFRTQPLHRRLLFRVHQGAGRVERLVGLGHCQLVRQDDDANVAEDGAHVHEAPQAPEPARGGGQKRSDLVAEGQESVFAVHWARNPVDGVFQERGDVG
jgi:hypothetical protein